MDYVTKYYKNLSEDLQRKVTLLEAMVAQVSPSSPSLVPPGSPPPPPPPPTPNPPTPTQPSPPPPPDDPGVWDPDGDGKADPPPSVQPPKREKGEDLEEYRRRRERWQIDRDNYREYLKRLREYNDYWARQRRRRQ